MSCFGGRWLYSLCVILPDGKLREWMVTKVMKMSNKCDIRKSSVGVASLIFQLPSVAVVEKIYERDAFSLLLPLFFTILCHRLHRGCCTNGGGDSKHNATQGGLVNKRDKA